MNKWSGLVRIKAVFASLCLVLLMLIGAGLTFSIQTDGLIINVEDVPYDPGTRWIYSVGGKGSGSQSRRLTIQLEKSNAGRSDLLESIYFLEGLGTKRLYVRVLSNAVATYSSPEESALIHKIQFPLKLGMEMEFQLSGLESEIGPVPAKVRVTAQEKISVPFGTFNCRWVIYDLYLVGSLGHWHAVSYYAFDFFYHLTPKSQGKHIQGHWV